MAYGWVAVKVNAARILQYPVTFDQSDCHISQIGKVVWIADALDTIQVMIEFRLIFSYGNQPFRLDILLPENVGKFGPFGTASNRCGEFLVLVEGRIQINQVNAVGIDAQHDIKVVLAEYGAVGNI